MTTAQPSSQRPVISGYYPDPSVCRVEQEYFLANSSFELFPGVPIWKSSDLINWELIGNALSRPSQFQPGHSAPSKGIYAPTLRHHEGRFYLITTDVPGRGHFVVTASDPAGPWSDPTEIHGIDGIDPDIAWDDDGSCYLTWCGSAPGVNRIYQSEVDLKSGTLLEEPRVVWTGTGAQWPEGPHLYHVGDWWYLLIAEGGTEKGHCVSVARSPSITGPFEGHPENPIFSHRSLGHPVQSVGHGDLVSTPDGHWAMVYLGTRPRGVMPGFHTNGRETFLAGIDWEDGWPVVKEDAYLIPHTDHSFDEIPVLPANPRWVSPGEPIDDIARPAPRGVCLRPGSAASGDISGMGLRITDQVWRFEAEVAGPGIPAIRLRYDDQHWYEISANGDEVHAEGRIGPATVTDSMVAHGPITLTMRSEPGGPGPDRVILGFQDDSGSHDLLDLDGRYLSTEVAGWFAGRVLVLHSLEGDATFCRVSYTGIEN